MFVTGSYTFMITKRVWVYPDLRLLVKMFEVDLPA